MTKGTNDVCDAHHQALKYLFELEVSCYIEAGKTIKINGKLFAEVARKYTAFCFFSITL